jgi:hypothetical protein
MRTLTRICRSLGLAALFVSALPLATTPTARAQVPVDLALVLALDSSASVDEGEFAVQRGGLAMAFRDPEVIEAIATGPFKRIAVTVIEWAGQNDQSVDVPWTVVDDAATAVALADRVDALERQILTGATSISGALTFANTLLGFSPFDASRKVIDLSGDGRNNQGPSVEVVRRSVVSQGVTINGLAIVNEHPTLNYYFEDRVIGGTSAFVEVAADYDAYPRAIRRKLIREIRTLNISRPQTPNAPHHNAPAVRLAEASRRAAGHRQ